MGTETRIDLPGLQLRCRRPMRRCVLQLSLQPLGQDRHTGIVDLEGTYEPHSEVLIGAVCHIDTPAHVAIAHYVRARAVDVDGGDLTPRLAEVLKTDRLTACRVAAAVAIGCRDGAMED